MYVTCIGPCTPTIKFISISALLLGPVIKLIHVGIFLSLIYDSRISLTACVIRGTIVCFGIIEIYVLGSKLSERPLFLLLKRITVPDSASVISLNVIPTSASSANDRLFFLSDLSQ